MEKQKTPGFIVVEGPIGVGKTTLARRLAETFGSDLLLEGADENPFLMQKDRLFAQLTLDDDELRLYEQVYAQMTLDAPLPDLVIYLQAPVEVLLQRVHARGVDYERHISESYLRSIDQAYINFFYHYDDSPLLIVNTVDFNLVDGSRNFEILLQHIQDLNPGRHYFNPREL